MVKSRFSSIDIKAVLQEIRREFGGLRVANVYDVDNKTYLIKFNKPDSKQVLLIESGIRIHITEYDWPKSSFPSGFSMKMRKHLKSRRLEEVVQLGSDRIVRLQFGSGDAAYYIILELYDRGNIVLTDHEFLIMNILRPRTDNSQDVKFVVREKYPLDLVKTERDQLSLEKLHELFANAKQNDNLKKVLNPALAYGPAVIDHCLKSAGFPSSASVGKGFDITSDIPRLLSAFESAEDFLSAAEEIPKGYIIQRAETKSGTEELLVYDEFHPFLFKQHESKSYLEFETFNKAVDQFFSQLEAQKIEMKTIQAEKAALKKLENVKKDHEKRLSELQSDQELDEKKAHIIQLNLDLVDRALTVIQSALANQMSWTDIDDVIKEAKAMDDPVALSIKGLKLEKNHFTMLLRDHYDEESQKPLAIDIDIALSAFGNAKRYYDQKRQAYQKEQKTVEASSKALKSAERKTKQALKEMKVTASIVKARKVMWFEKFNWFVSSENYLVLAGRDGQQNEMLVRRYLKAGDVYVHADIHGASSVIVKNPSGEPIPPKTLNEAGTMAICHSAAWDAKVVTSAWWVHHDQVSKTAPTGEYLTTGSFMIRGKKNYLPPTYLVYGFAMLFKLDEDSIERHKGERKARALEEDLASVTTEGDTEQEVELEGASSDEESGDETNKPHNHLETVGEEEVGKDSMEKAENDDNEIVENEEEAEESEREAAEKSDKDIEESNDEERNSGTSDSMKHEVRKAEAREEESEESDDDSAFPDTQLNIKQVSNMKFEVRQTSRESRTSFTEDAQSVADDTTSKNSKPAMSRKQRREMRKQKKQKNQEQEVHDENEDDDKTDKAQASSQPVVDENEETGEGQPRSGKQKQQPQQQAPPKRGQHGKNKKIKKKYADQDEEERELRSTLLHAVQKDTKKRQKQKVQQQQKEEAQARKAEQQKKYEALKQNKRKKQLQQTDANKVSAVIDAEDLDEADDDNIPADEMNVLDTLTGLPAEEDTLLYAIPFCAPYSALHNFKFKVKVIPGSTKRGKAVKSAVQAFLFDKSISQREKELIKSLKDVDMSRNIPGKVKVTSSQVNKAKARR